MSGGVAFVWDPERDFHVRCNRNHGLTELEPVEDEEDIALLRGLIQDHLHYTNSDRAADILRRWDETLPQFVKVVSVEYRRIQAQRAAHATTATH
jgi:glutamate synthase domain-containing protein 3